MAIYASRARTLVDAVYDWSRFNSLPRAYEWIRNDLRQKRVDVEELVTITLRFGNTGTIRRMGALLELEGVGESLLRRLEEPLNQTRSMIPWIPNLPKRGKINRRWGVVLNEPS
jgi:predicted transcriptional regulator of viral defense system